MRNTLLVVKYEIVTTLQKRSFWLLTFLFPAFVLILSLGTQFIGQKAIEQAEEEASSVEAQAQLESRVGYVDQAGIIQKIPIWIPADFFEYYPDEQAAEADMQAGRLRQYYLIPSDFLENGEYILVDREYQPLRSMSNAEIFEEVIQTNLLENVEFSAILDNPTPHIQYHQLEISSGPDKQNPLTFIVPFATLFIFFFTITSSSGFMLSSVSREKENRTAEILLLSIKPRELMLGKVVGLGCVALLQMSIWMSGALFSLSRSKELAGFSTAFSLPPGFLGWGLLYFIFGYFLYASLLGAIGALAPNAREGGQFTFIIILPLLIPIWFNVAFTEAPNGPVAMFLSMFPLTSISMMTRITATEVPLWQILLSLAGLAFTTYLVILLSARFFQAETLLSSDNISLKRVFRAFKRRQPNEL
jgi:ABC-2 type transport system permease protein